MRRVTGIGGIFFKARDAVALRAWYQRHLGIDVQEWGGAAFTWTDAEGKAATGTTIWTISAAEGGYTVRVYLMRAAARRNEASDYTLTVGVTGKPLAALPASQDAVLPGTPFHASAQVTCVPFLETKPRQCEAFVIRRGVDGTATVEIAQPNSGKRLILFVQGKPVASDSQDALSFSRQGDVTVVKLGADERYEIPDAFVAGG